LPIDLALEEIACSFKPFNKTTNQQIISRYRLIWIGNNVYKSNIY